MEDEEVDEIKQGVGHETFGRWRWDEAWGKFFEEVALEDDVVEFLALPAYQLLD